MKPMRERNQVLVAIVGTAIIAAIVLLSMNLGRLPFLNPKTTYHAQFQNADGLTSGADVRVLGISVGSVSSVKVERVVDSSGTPSAVVAVAFTVKDGVHLGDQSRASIEVATVLGQLYLQVESAGSGHLKGGGTIPVSRTTQPYTLLGALDAFGNFAGQTDLGKLQTSLKTLAASISGISPRQANTALAGLTDVAKTLAGKQEQISSILSSANAITTTLNANTSALLNLLGEGDAFLKMAQQRQTVINQLLQSTADLGKQITTLISNNGAQLGSLLSNLNAVTAVLAKDKTQLEQAVINLGQFSVNIANATGSGPWLDLLTPTVVVPDNQIKACGAHPDSSKGPCG
jgi:phospholipid/cholesterol/gamma-HCH transport system substrate-binding protein